MGAFDISVIVPNHNGAEYLAPAIDSILDQTCLPAEIVVVDDGSTDDSVAVIRSYQPRVRWVPQDHLGPAAARNTGIRSSTGQFLAFLDADDMWMPEKLAQQLQVLGRESSCDAVLGRVENFVSPGLNESQRRALTRAASQAGNIHIGALLIRRHAFLRVGWFDTRWRQGEFVDWWARATRLGLSYVILPELVLRRRLHTANLTLREPQNRDECVEILGEHLLENRKKVVPTSAARQE